MKLPKQKSDSVEDYKKRNLKEVDTQDAHSSQQAALLSNLPQRVLSANVLQLQRMIGNKAVQRLLKTPSGTQSIQRDESEDNQTQPYSIKPAYVTAENYGFIINVHKIEIPYVGRLHGKGVTGVSVDGETDFRITDNEDGSILAVYMGYDPEKHKKWFEENQKPQNIIIQYDSSKAPAISDSSADTSAPSDTVDTPDNSVDSSSTSDTGGTLDNATTDTPADASATQDTDKKATASESDTGDASEKNDGKKKSGDKADEQYKQQLISEIVAKAQKKKMGGANLGVNGLKKANLTPNQLDGLSALIDDVKMSDPAPEKDFDKFIDKAKKMME